MSGGRATVYRNKGSLYRQSGDICAVSIEGHSLTDNFYFELKHHKNLELPQFFVKGKGTLFRFWEKTQSEARYYHLRPVMIVRQNNYPILVITRRNSLPSRWMVYSKRFSLHLAHIKTSVFMLDDILASDYKPIERERINDA
jgi:hypothetical protein